MRLVREITAEEENFRMEPAGQSPDGSVIYSTIRRDPVEPEPVGTIVLMAFRITGYDKDCDGSLMARLTQIDYEEGEEAGSETKNHGLYPSTEIVISEGELKALYKEASIPILAFTS